VENVITKDGDNENGKGAHRNKSQKSPNPAVRLWLCYIVEN
jgi:hypothetical protein